MAIGESHLGAMYLVARSAGYEKQGYVKDWVRSLRWEMKAEVMLAATGRMELMMWL